MRILVVANRTAAVPWLMQEIAARAHAEIALLVPPAKDDWPVAVAREQVERAAGRRVELVDAGRDAGAAIERALRARRCDEALVSIRPARRARRLARRIEALDVAVTVVAAGERPTAERGVLKVRW